MTASPYSANYKTNLTHDQRELIAHRKFVTKLQRHELEDRYLSILDEHFSMKKENLTNHDKIRKLVTKILRLTSGSDRQRSSSAHTKASLSTDEDLQIK